MDQNFAYKHLFLLYKLKYLCRLFGFDGQSAWTGNITQIAKATLVLKDHSKKLLFFVTILQYYPIVFGYL